jgi:hypothetical protein
LPVPRGARSAGAEEERGVLAGAERQEEQEGAEEGAVGGGAAPMLLLLPARLEEEKGEGWGGRIKILTCGTHGVVVDIEDGIEYGWVPENCIFCGD